MDAQLVKTLVYFFLGGFLVFLAIAVTRDNFSNRLNRIAGSLLALAGLGPFFMGLGQIIGPAQISGIPFEETSLYNLYYVWEFFFPALLLFSLYFPVDQTRLLQIPRLKILIIVPQVIHLILVLGFNDISGLLNLAESAQSQQGFYGLIIQPFAFVAVRLLLVVGWLRSFETSVFGFINLLYVGAAAFLLESGRRLVTNPRLFAQVDVVLWGTRSSLGLYTLSLLLSHYGTSPLAATFGWASLIGAMVAGAGFFAYAIVRHQFLDVRLVVRQSLVYTLTSAVIVGAYVFMGMSLEDALRPVFGEKAKLISYISVLFVLLLFQPISSWVDNIVRSMFIRSRTDYRNVLERFSRQIISVIEPEQIRQSIDEILKTGLLVENVYFIMFDDRVGEYAVMSSEDHSSRIIIERDDLMLRGINLLDSPTPYSSLAEYDHDSELATHLNELQVRIVVPLKDTKHLLGFLALSSKAAGYRYSSEDYNLLGTLSNQMVTALTNARLYVESLERMRLQEEVSMARQIQLDLLPSKPPELDSTEISAQSTPSRTVGGDFYDFIHINNSDKIGIVIADASGKGMPAALMIAQVQAIIRSEVNNGSPISNMMKNMNDLIVQNTSAEKYVTLFYGELDTRTGQFLYANAGHNYPIVARADGSRELLEIGGPVIGAFRGMEYTSSSVQLNKDDLLFLFTDGLSEAMDKEGSEYTEERIRDFVVKCRQMTPGAIIDELIADVRSFDPTYPPQDDTTVIAIKMTGRKNNGD